jgi:hypothetical protein
MEVTYDSYRWMDVKDGSVTFDGAVIGRRSWWLDRSLDGLLARPKMAEEIVKLSSREKSTTWIRSSIPDLPTEHTRAK